VELKQMSEVAYIRFASVYRQFQGIDDFVSTLETMNQKPGPGHLAAVG
jgi:transcriptional repressor NrdR